LYVVSLKQCAYYTDWRQVCQELFGGRPHENYSCSGTKKDLTCHRFATKIGAGHFQIFTLTLFGAEG